jgi:hypothetical protein
VGCRGPMGWVSNVGDVEGARAWRWKVGLGIALVWGAPLQPEAPSARRSATRGIPRLPAGPPKPAMADGSWQAFKKAGNDAFAAGKMREAADAYSSALRAGDVPDGDRATLLCNRAQASLKLGENASAVDDCTACLTISPGNVKALFRR